MTTSLFKTAHQRPLLVLATHVPWLLLWIVFPITDLLDGSVQMKNRHILSYENQPFIFAVFTLIIFTAALFCVMQIIVATLELDKKDTAKSED